MPKGPNTYTEEELLRGIRMRDKTTLEYMNREYRPFFRLLIYKMGGSRDDAKDLFQEAIIALMKKARDPLFRPASSIKTLLCAIGKNKWKNKLRTLNSRTWASMNNYSGLPSAGCPLAAGRSSFCISRTSGTRRSGNRGSTVS